MSVLIRLRQYHALLGSSVVLAYASGEWGIVHAWLGYLVALLIFIRLIFALSGAPQLGLFRYYPLFRGLRLGNMLTHPAISRTLLSGIALLLIATTATGLYLDQSSGFAQLETMSQAYADDTHRRGAGTVGRIAAEVHEVLANGLMVFVVLHVSYLILFKWPLAAFMLFLRHPAREGR